MGTERGLQIVKRVLHLAAEWDNIRRDSLVGLDEFRALISQLNATSPDLKGEVVECLNEHLGPTRVQRWLHQLNSGPSSSHDLGVKLQHSYLQVQSSVGAAEDIISELVLMLEGALQTSWGDVDIEFPGLPSGLPCGELADPAASPVLPIDEGTHKGRPGSIEEVLLGLSHLCSGYLQEVEIMRHIASALDLAASLDELSTYCFFWELQPFVSCEVLDWLAALSPREEGQGT